MSNSSKNSNDKDKIKKLVQTELFGSKIQSSSGMFDVFGYTGGSKNKNGPIVNAPPKVTNIYYAKKPHLTSNQTN